MFGRRVFGPEAVPKAPPRELADPGRLPVTRGHLAAESPDNYWYSVTIAVTAINSVPKEVASYPGAGRSVQGSANPLDRRQCVEKVDRDAPASPLAPAATGTCPSLSIWWPSLRCGERTSHDRPRGPSHIYSNGPPRWLLPDCGRQHRVLQRAALRLDDGCARARGARARPGARSGGRDGPRPVPREHAARRGRPRGRSR